MTDKRYRECMAEIAGILQKYDMAGAVTVVSKERAMFKYVFPTWSCIKIENSHLRFRARRVDFPSAEAHKEALELSVHVIMQIRDIAAQTFAFCQQIAGGLADKLDIEHVPYHDFNQERDN